MIDSGQRVEIDISSPRRRELLAMLCEALNAGLSLQDHWEAGCELRHWQATSSAFESLPEAIIRTIFDEWTDGGERLEEIEFSGYLDTEEGHRAWGFIALRIGQPRVEGRPEIEHLTVYDDAGVYVLKAAIIRTALEREQGYHA